MAETPAKDQTTRTVRTAMRPFEELEVTEAQEAELRDLGLLTEKKTRSDA